MENNEKITTGTELFVPINDRSIKVEKLGLLTYAKMSGILRGLIASVIEVMQEQAQMQEDTDAAPQQRAIFLADLVSRLVEKNVMQVINFIDLCVPDLGREYIEQKVGIYEMILLAEAILKVNNVNKAVDEGKKLITNYMKSRMPQ